MVHRYARAMGAQHGNTIHKYATAQALTHTYNSGSTRAPQHTEQGQEEPPRPPREGHVGIEGTDQVASMSPQDDPG